MKTAGVCRRDNPFEKTVGRGLAPAVLFGVPVRNRRPQVHPCPSVRMPGISLAAVLPLLLLLFTGCSGASKEIERGMALRANLLKASSCTFDTEITADYGDALYSFSMSCEADARGSVAFTVTAPQTISGITGEISGDGGRLTFDDTALQFDLMADGQVTPVSAPWILMRTLRGGCLTSAGTEGDLLRLSIDDSYADDALNLDIWLDAGNVPVRGEILFDGRRILSLTVTNFRIS